MPPLSCPVARIELAEWCSRCRDRSRPQRGKRPAATVGTIVLSATGMRITRDVCPLSPLRLSEAMPPCVVARGEADSMKRLLDVVQDSWRLQRAAPQLAGQIA